jgi:hypothetical protein
MVALLLIKTKILLESQIQKKQISTFYTCLG